MAKLKLQFAQPLPTDEFEAKADGNVIQFVNNQSTISITKAMHNELVQHCKDRLDWAEQKRSPAIERYTRIDKELAGFIKLDEEDAARKKDTEEGFGPKPYPIYLQLTKTQLDEAMTFLMTVYFPEEGPYAATAPKEKQDVAKAFTMLMNKQASLYKHYLHFAKFAFDGLRYNMGLVAVDWDTHYGTAVSTADDKVSAKIIPDRLLYSGNKLTYLDPYNTLYDPSCEPVDLAENGEFFATVTLESNFKLRRKLARAQLFNLTLTDLSAKSMPTISYYKEKPQIVSDNAGQAQNGTNWISVLTASQASNTPNAIGISEVVKLRMWLDASMWFEDVPEDQENMLGIYEVEIWNGNRIVNLKQLKNAHGLLPVFAVRPWDDNFAEQTTSFAEMLLPYQRFSSFQMNIHQYAARKALYGLTFLNGRIFGDVPNTALAGGVVKTKSTQELEDIRKHVYQVFDNPGTDNTLRDIEFMDTLMQKILPTDILKQVTDLERATKYQSAATVQGANRRNLKIAQMMDAQAVDKMRQVQMYNILEYQESMELLDSESGKLVEVNPADFRDAQIEFVLGAGLRGMDKLIIMELIKEVLNMVLQNQAAAQTFDVPAVINYLTSLAGDSTNFAQFKYQNEFDKLTPEQKQMAYELLAQAMQTQAQQQGNPQNV